LACEFHMSRVRMVCPLTSGPHIRGRVLLWTVARARWQQTHQHTSCRERSLLGDDVGELTASQDVAALLSQTASSSGAVSVLPQTTSSASESNAQLGVAALPQPAGLLEAVVCLPRLTGYVQSSTGPSDVASANPCTVRTDSTSVRTPGQVMGIPRTSII